jgi:hypothetical protein
MVAVRDLGGGVLIGVVLRGVRVRLLENNYSLTIVGWMLQLRLQDEL